MPGGYPVWRNLAGQQGSGYQKASFRQQPICARATGAAASGTTGHTNIMVMPDAAFEYFILGAGQTIVAPVIGTAGLDVALDLTADEGCEISQGITARNPVAFTIGGAPFYAELELAIADVSGTDDCYFGFRKLQAYQAAVDDYTDMAVFNVIGGAINIETILNNAATTTTDTTDTLADGVTRRLGVYVSAGGVVTYKHGASAAAMAAPTTVAAFTFDAGDIVIPFFGFLHDATSPGAITLKEYLAGYQ